MAAGGAHFPTPEPGAGLGQSPEASAGNRGRLLVRFGSDFSLSGVLALNNVSRNNGAGKQQYWVFGKGFYGPEGDIELASGCEFPRWDFPSWQRATFHTNYSSSYLEVIAHTYAYMQRHCLACRAWRLWLGSLPGPLKLMDLALVLGGR